MKILSSAVAILTTIFRWLSVACVAAMALLIAVSVVLRATSTPLGGEHELVELMMVGVVMLGLAYTHKVGGHISIGLLVDRFSPRWQAKLDVLAVMLIAGTCLLIGWANLRMAYDYATGSSISTDFLSIPLFPFKIMVSLGFLLWGLQAIVSLAEKPATKTDSGRALAGGGNP
ncbi:TRAP transporter small permease [Piscinibacter sakaiensis]|uniref:TRAP transporter small permease n=1 Tax=Piscinibacter sakaiensis TaxID=1547922 RepID=UPI003AABCCB7